MTYKHTCAPSFHSRCMQCTMHLGYDVEQLPHPHSSAAQHADTSTIMPTSAGRVGP